MSKKYLHAALWLLSGSMAPTVIHFIEQQFAPNPTTNVFFILITGIAVIGSVMGFRRALREASAAPESNGANFEMWRRGRAMLSGGVVLLLLGYVFITMVLPNVKSLHALRREAKTTVGKVVSVFPGNHDTCSYSFIVEGKERTGTGNSCSRASIGQEMKIYYLPGNPDISVNKEPEDLYWNVVGFWIVVFLIVPAFAFSATYNKKRRPKPVNV